MIRSTVGFKSNLRLAKKNVPLSEDKDFYQSIIDPFAIGILKKYRGNDLTELQREIYNKAGIHCMHAEENDYPWGLIIDENESLRVVCKCMKVDCERFNICRPEMKIEKNLKTEDSFGEKILKNNTSFTLKKEMDCSFEQYAKFSSSKKMKLLLDYWELIEGPIVRIRFNENKESYLYNENGNVLLNPFTRAPIILENVDTYKFSHLVFDIVETCSDINDLIHFVRTESKEGCKAWASEILYRYELTKNNENCNSESKKKRRKTSSEIKEKYGLAKDPKYCRHAGCYELAVRDGYCSEHIRYQKAESK